MRVALCLSGHLRSYDQTYTSLKNCIIDPLKADVFIHTWDKIGLSPGIDLRLMFLETKNCLNTINNCFNPIETVIEPLVIGLGERFRPRLVDKRCPNGVTNMFYKIAKADELRQNYETKNNFKYDAVIRCRPDLLFNRPINNLHVEDSIKNNCLYLPDFGHFDGFNDQFAFGSNEMMTLYAKCYSELDKWAPKVPFKPEPLLKHHVMENKITLKFSNVDYFLRRSNGTNFDNRVWSNGIPDLTRW